MNSHKKGERVYGQWSNPAFLKRYVLALLLLPVQAAFAGADSFTDELQWLAKYTACIGQYSRAQAGNYALGDPQDYYKPADIREYLAKQSGTRTSTATFYGICFDYAQAAYNEISAARSRYENLGMQQGGWYIAVAHGNPNQIVLYDPVSKDKATLVLNGVNVKESSRQNVRSHEGATNHAWLWVYEKDGAIYWIDPTWTDNTGYVWWGVVRNGREEQFAPSAQFCAIQVDPNGAGFADFNRGNASKNLSEYDRAIADYTEALRKDPRSAAAYVNRGLAYFKKGMDDQAIADYTAALRLDPNNAIAYTNRGGAYVNKGMDDQAIADCTAALRINPNLSMAYANRGGAYAGKRMDAQAIVDCTTALRLDPNNAIAYTNRSSVYDAKKMYDQALEDCNAALMIDPGFAAAYINRGIAYAGKKMYDRAITDYDAALGITPNDAEVYFNRGGAYRNKGMYDQAIADYSAALRIDPNFAAAYGNRAATYGMKGNYGQALADYSAALRINPNDATAKQGVEWARKARGY
jgi:tetratricopeptide (TPR) repeat protein